jgi:hypothetical protein
MVIRIYMCLPIQLDLYLKAAANAKPDDIRDIVGRDVIVSQDELDDRIKTLH